MKKVSDREKQHKKTHKENMFNGKVMAHKRNHWYCLRKNCAPPNSKRTQGDSLLKHNKTVRENGLFKEGGLHFQLPPGKVLNNPTIILACFSGSWSKKRIPCHCTRASIFWSHKLNSEYITISPSSNAKTLWVSRAVFMFMPSTGSLWTGRSALRTGDPGWSTSTPHPWTHSNWWASTAFHHLPVQLPPDGTVQVGSDVPTTGYAWFPTWALLSCYSHRI